MNNCNYKEWIEKIERDTKTDNIEKLIQLQNSLKEHVRLIKKIIREENEIVYYEALNSWLSYVIIGTSDDLKHDMSFSIKRLEEHKK